VGAANVQIRWYLQPVGGTPLAGEFNGTLSSFTINTTTTFYVAINDGGPCESERTAVTATVVAPDPIQAIATPSTICLGTSFDLSVQQTGSNQNYTYTWTASPEAGSGITGSAVGSPVTITPTIAGTYTYNVAANDDDCNTSSSVEVIVQALPAIVSITANPSTVCAGEPVSLEALTGSFAPGEVTIGTQTTTIGGVDGNPYRSGNGTGNEIRTQLLVTAAELTAQGLTAGNISSLSFLTTSVGGTVIDFNISLAHTSVSALTTTFETSGFVNVFNQASFTAVVGWNTHTFQTPFNWDGVSNIVINVCQENSVTGTNTVAAFTPTYASNVHRASSTTSCTTATGTAVTNKPLIRFGGITGSAGPGTLTWSWDNGGGSGNAVTVNPLATTTYTVTGTDPVTTCSNTASVLVNVNPIPAEPTATSSEQCGTAIPTASVSSNSGDPSPIFKWYDAPTGGNLLQTDASTTYLSAIGTTTTFYVSELSSAGCEGNRVAVTVTVQEPDAITASVSSASVCIGSSFNISSSYTPDFNNYTAYSLSALPEAGSGVTGSVSLVANGSGSDPYAVTPTTSGTYAYVITAQDPDKGCETTDTITVTVNLNPLISSAIASPSTVCFGETVNLSAQSINASSGTATVGAGATTNSSYPAPFYSLWSNKHEQILIPAAELTASGLVTGPITSIGFPTTSGTISPADFTVKLAHTNVSDMSAFVTTGLTQVYFAATQPQVASTNNVLTFQTPFIWDGVSNLVVDICFGNASSSATLSSTSPADNTPYISVIKTHTSSATSSSISCPDTALIAAASKDMPKDSL